MSFFNKLKSAFGGKQKPPQYRQYTPSELKVIAMKTRLILEQHRQTLMQHITKQDQQFRYAGQDPKKVYDILQSIGQKVIEAESLKILIEMVRKIQGHTSQIITTHGDVSKLKGQIQWFQCVLWYRRSRQITNLEDLFSFCYNFFKGIDITTQLNVHCEVFQFYPIMKYLPKNGGFPLHELLPYIEPYVNHKIDPSIIDNVVGMSKMINSGMGPQHQSYINPHPGPVNPPNPHNSYHYPQNNNVPPYVPPKQPNKPQSDVNPYQTDPYRQNSQNFSNNPYQNPQPNNPNPYPNVPGYPNNSNIPGNPNQPNPNYSNIPLNPNYSNLPTPNQQNSNISRPNHQSYDPTHTPTYPNPHFSPYSPSQQSNNPYQTKSPEKQPHPQPKKTFYGSIMKGPTPNYDRQSFEREHNQQYGSQVPFNRDTPEEGFNDIDQTIKELEQIEKKQSQMQESKKRDEEKKAREMEEARKIREEQQARKRIEEELRLQEQQKRRKEEEERRKQEEERLRKEQEQRLRKEEEQRIREQAQRMDRERRQAERRVKEQEDEEQKLIDELKRQNQMEKQQEEDEDQALLREAEERFGLQDQEEEQNDKEKEQEVEVEQDPKSESSSEKEEREWEEKREQIERELDEREQQLEINVFEDNEREDLDRGMSGRFSNNFGMKVDFGDNDGEQFNYNSGRQIQTSMLRFNTNNSKEDDEPSNSPPSAPSAPDRPQQDQKQSLEIIKKHAGCEPETTFKLFYFKRMELNQ